MPNAYQADGFLGGFYQALNTVRGISAEKRQNARQDEQDQFQREDRAEAAVDRTSSRKLRDIQIDSAQRGLDAAETPEEARARRGDETKARGLNLNIAQRGLDTAETPEEARARRGQEGQARTQGLAAGGLAMEATRVNIDSAREKLVNDRATRTQKEALPVIQEIGTLLSSNPEAVNDNDMDRFTKAWGAFGVKLDTVLSPEYGQAEQTLQAAMKSGNLGDRATLPAWNVVFKDRLNRTSGETTEADLQRPNGMGGSVTIPKGSKILDRELIGVKEAEDGKGVYGVLRVGYKTPDGKEGTYIAPVDKSRTAGSNGDPAYISIDDALRTLTGQSQLRRSLTADPNILARTTAFINARRSAAGAKGAQSSQQQYLQFVADNVYDGDIKKAYSSVRGGNARQIAATMAGKMADLQKNGPSKDRKPYDQLYQEAMTMVQGAAAAGGEDPAAADATADTQGGQLVGHTPEGKPVFVGKDGQQYVDE